MQTMLVWKDWKAASLLLRGGTPPLLNTDSDTKHVENGDDGSKR